MSWFTLHRVEDQAFVNILDDIGSYRIGWHHFERELGDAQKVHVTIDSVGGDALTAFEVYRILRERQTEVIIKRAYSAGLIVAMAGKKISIEPKGKIMTHAACCYTYGDAKKLRANADALDDTNEKIITLLCAKTGQPRGVVAGWKSNGDRYFTAREALELGLVHEITPPKPQAPTQPSTTKPIAVKAETEDERCFRAILSGFSDLTVSDKEGFRRDLERWFMTSVRQNTNQ